MQERTNTVMVVATVVVIGMSTAVLPGRGMAQTDSRAYGNQLMTKTVRAEVRERMRSAGSSAERLSQYPVVRLMV